MKQVAVYGASGFGRQVMPFARMSWAANDEPHQLAFVDDNLKSVECNGHKVFTYEEWLQQPSTSKCINIAIANGNVREALVKRCMRDNVGFFDIWSPNVVVLDDVVIGSGGVFCSFVTLTSNIRIGNHFHANHYSHVAHDCVIGDYVTFGPGVRCNGNVVIEDYVYIGTGAVIKQGSPGNPIVIGRGAVVGMGAVVTKSVPAGATVVGNPAKPLQKMV